MSKRPLSCLLVIDVQKGFHDPHFQTAGRTTTLLECIRSGDLDVFRDVPMAHLMTVNKVAVAKKAGIGQRTLYDLIDPKKDFNPELSTVSAVIRALTA